MQDEIAAAVVEQLKIKLLGEAPKAKEVDPKAYALFLQARQLRRQNTPEGFEQAIALFQQALAIDPNYAAAWDGAGRRLRQSGRPWHAPARGGRATRARGRGQGARDRPGLCTGPRPPRLDRDGLRRGPGGGGPTLRARTRAGAGQHRHHQRRRRPGRDSEPPRHRHRAQ